MTDKMREEFEAWQMRNMVGSGISEVFAKSSLSRDAEGAYSPIVGFAWSVWQASRAALAVDLPEGAEAQEFMFATKVINAGSVIDALEAAGVQVK